MFSCKTQDVALVVGLDEDDVDDGDLDPDEEEAAPATRLPSTTTSTTSPSNASLRLPPLLGRELKEEATEEASAGQEVARE